MLISNISPNPSKAVIKNESEHLLLCFCTFCSLLKGKKLSLQNIFILVLQEKKLRDILKELLTIETNFDVVKLFIDFEPSITKSKYITKFLNANSNIKL
tara:strand:+ start:1329 stop:1625 length:297 start_codon:yes stop_codon:yes gene_type:complete